MSAEAKMERMVLVGLTAGGALLGGAVALVATVATHFLWTAVTLGWFFAWLAIGASAGAALPVLLLLTAWLVNLLRERLTGPNERERRMPIGASAVGALWGAAVGAFAVLLYHYAVAPLPFAWGLAWLAPPAIVGAAAPLLWSHLRRRFP